MVRWSGMTCCNEVMNFRTGVYGNRNWERVVYYRVHSRNREDERWQEQERSWIHVVQERTIMQFFLSWERLLVINMGRLPVLSQKMNGRELVWCIIMGRLPPLSQKRMWGFYDLLKMRLSSIHRVRMQLNLSHLPRDTVHGGLETILVSYELDVMFSVEHVLCHCQLIQLCEVIVTVQIFFFGLNQPASLHNINLTIS